VTFRGRCGARLSHAGIIAELAGRLLLAWQTPVTLAPGMLLTRSEWSVVKADRRPRTSLAELSVVNPTGPFTLSSLVLEFPPVPNFTPVAL
jgi:hypothetical protein